jgi:flagellar operon protein (TIGR03826 family)
MTATNCPRCGRLFTQVRSPVCPACEKAEEEVFNRLKDYIEENPFCTMAALSDATHVSTKQITRFIRDGRLEISKGMSYEIGCEKCGKPIQTGRYCDSCAVEISRQVNQMFGKMPIEVDSSIGSKRMHVSHPSNKKNK